MAFHERYIKDYRSLIDGKYSASGVSRITDVVREKVEAYRNRPIKKWYPIVFIDGTAINIRRGFVDGEVVYPKADFQSCILPKARSSLKKVRVRHRQL